MTSCKAGEHQTWNLLVKRPKKAKSIPIVMSTVGDTCLFWAGPAFGVDKASF
jgi:hypothetical protein